MKRVFISFILVLLSLVTQAQNTYEKAMQEAFSQMGKAQGIADLQKIANQFEMIGKNAPKEWHPNYYAAFVYARMSYQEENLDKKDIYVEKALKIWESINEKNDEIYLLRAFIAQASLAVDGQGRWQTQGSIFDENIAKAMKINPSNPRIYYVQGTRLYHTPKMFGGGAKAAMPLFEKAKTLFESFTPTSTFAPKWGKNETTKYLDLCKNSQ
ncbi:MAG: hypothetical protein MUC49_17205 [Raineya sp.]|jgi:tetratricopeptide (TPR) repeat protein|nr:hypothetical protein [Raineya sp.]